MVIGRLGLTTHSMGCGLGPGHQTPYALPDGTEPLFVADFKNGVYLVDGETAALEDIFVQDLNWGTFNPATAIVAGVGMTRTGGNAPSPVVATSNLATLLHNSTVILTWTWAGGIGGSIYCGHSDIVNYDDEHVVQLNADGTADCWDNGPEFVTTNIEAGPGKVAATFTPEHQAMSVNGEQTLSFVPTISGEVNAIALNVTHANWVLEQVAFYTVQADGALPALSALS